MTHGGVSGTAVFSFDDRGRFIGLTADRYFGGGPDAKTERWEIEAKEWKAMDGCLVPVRGDVRWKLAEGDFTFYRWELTELEYGQNRWQPIVPARVHAPASLASVPRPTCCSVWASLPTQVSQDVRLE